MYVLVDAALVVNASNNILNQYRLGSEFGNTVVEPWMLMAAFGDGSAPPGTSRSEWVEAIPAIPDHYNYQCALGDPDNRYTALSTAVFNVADMAARGNIDSASLYFRLSDVYHPIGAAFVSDISLTAYRSVGSLRRAPKEAGRREAGILRRTNTEPDEGA